MPVKDFSCCHYGHMICIINGEYGNIITLNATTKQFIDTIKIPECGYGTSSIFGAKDSCNHLIFDPSTKKLTTLKDEHQIKVVTDSSS